MVTIAYTNDKIWHQQVFSFVFMRSGVQYERVLMYVLYKYSAEKLINLLVKNFLLLLVCHDNSNMEHFQKISTPKSKLYK